jgi:hypothetical protein
MCQRKISIKAKKIKFGRVLVLFQVIWNFEVAVVRSLGFTNPESSFNDVGGAQSQQKERRYLFSFATLLLMFVIE